MLTQTDSPLAAPQVTDPSALSKGVRAPFHLELSPTSPVVNGLRQSTIAFKVQRTKTSSQLVAANDRNIAPVLNVAEAQNDSDAAVKVSKPHSSGAVRRLKQTLLIEEPQTVEPSRPPAKNVQKFAKSTRSRRTATHRSVSVFDRSPASGEQQLHRQPKACSLSPKKQLRAKSPVLQTKTATMRLQQTQLPNFGIRRTARQFAKDMQQQKEAEVISTILKSEESGMKVVITEDKGRGVLTTRTFLPGEFVVEYIGELISGSEARTREAEYNKDPNVGSFMFFFSHGNQRYCVDATEETGKLGRLINHSRLHPNCVVKVIPINGIPRLALFAKTEIPPGEELLYDYGDRGKASLIAHPWLKT
ncbi:histone lysine n methyltransferase setd8 [Echinococcus multilocularis]|uniref:[histone H4]-lysine(20) N-methyltransferase n=1 Tax=Echinococcus multilocularis TaxID=6211 RepID=A0A068YCU8_ECHMU|nr:histone lysine n methyltransferase setd8 [Echinococcus multilocularis]